MAASAGTTTWLQRIITLGAKRRGCHLVHDELLRQLPELATFEVGLAHFFIQHTSASLTLNENADPDVRKDMESALNRIAPESADYAHSDEGLDDMPAHIKSSVVGAGVTVPIGCGRLLLGTWQGLWLCEHRAAGGPRSVVVTVSGLAKQAK
jgi:secondary thiamine-phosphate synthase enzyme